MIQCVIWFLEQTENFEIISITKKSKMEVVEFDQKSA